VGWGQEEEWGKVTQGRRGVIMQKGRAHKFAIFLELLSNANDV